MSEVENGGSLRTQSWDYDNFTIMKRDGRSDDLFHVESRRSEFDIRASEIDRVSPNDEDLVLHISLNDDYDGDKKELFAHRIDNTDDGAKVKLGMVKSTMIQWSDVDFIAAIYE